MFISKRSVQISPEMKRKGGQHGLSGFVSFRIVLKRGRGREGGRTERNGRWGKAETRLHFLSVRPEKTEGKGLSGLGGQTNSTPDRLLDSYRTGRHEMMWEIDRDYTISIK